MAIRAQPPLPEQQQTPWLPPGPPMLMFDQFQGISTSTSRSGVKEDKAWWLDSMFPIGPRDLRAIPGVGAPLFTVADTVEPGGTTIAFFDFTNLLSFSYCLAFLSNGSIYRINTVTRVLARIAVPGTITNPSRLMTGMCQYGSQYAIIVTQQTNGYFIWDGTTFFAPGDVFGGGTVPTGIGGSAVEIYAGRVWIANNANIVFSAPGSIRDFTTGSGGGSFSSTDSFLRVAFSALKQSNGFLYMIGDSSVNYISGVQTSSGSPPVTTFTNQNADPEVGSPYPGSVSVYGRNIMFANAWGVHINYGAAVTKVSEDLDGIYNTVPNFGGFIPSAGKAIIFSKKVWMVLIPIIDPYSGQQVNKLLLWDGKRWFPATQDAELIYIQHQELASVLITYGTNGTTIWPLFTNPSAEILKVAMSKLWDDPGIYATKATNRLFGMLQYYTQVANEISVRIDNEQSGTAQVIAATSPTVSVVNEDGDPVTTINNLSQLVTWVSSGGQISVFEPTAVAQHGVLLGMTFTTQCPDMALIAMGILPEDVGYRG